MGWDKTVHTWPARGNAHQACLTPPQDGCSRLVGSQPPAQVQ